VALYGDKELTGLCVCRGLRRLGWSALKQNGMALTIHGLAGPGGPSAGAIRGRRRPGRGMGPGKS